MTAEQQLKNAFPDWKDWPEWALPATVEIIEKYARECVISDRKQINELYLSNSNVKDGFTFSCPFDPDTITNLPIVL